MDNLDTGNIRHTRHRTKTKINTTQHNTENGYIVNILSRDYG
jgi:hypothetical protein